MERPGTAARLWGAVPCRAAPRNAEEYDSFLPDRDRLSAFSLTRARGSPGHLAGSHLARDGGHTIGVLELFMPVQDRDRLALPRLGGLAGGLRTQDGLRDQEEAPGPGA